MDEPKTKRKYTRKPKEDTDRAARIERAIAHASAAKAELPEGFTPAEDTYAINQRDIEDATNENLARHYARLNKQEAK